MNKSLKTQFSVDKPVFFDKDVPPHRQLRTLLKHLFQPSLEVVSLGVVIRLLLLEMDFGDVCLPVLVPERLSAT